MKEKSKIAIKKFFASAVEQFTKFVKGLSWEDYTEAVDIILASQSQKKPGRLHITGIGKPGHVAAYAASLFSSTGTPAYMLHGTEAVHGSCGQLVEGDVVIAISNSGKTKELLATVKAIKKNGCKIIAVTGDRSSELAEQADCVLYAGVEEEGGPLNRAPRNSFNAEILTLQALSVALQVEARWNENKYVRCHPGGELGKIRDSERKD